MRTLTLAAALGLMTIPAFGGDLAQSPRGAESRAAQRTVTGVGERRGFEFRAGKAGELSSRAASGPSDRDLVRESRIQVYTGKNSPQRNFEIAPVK